MLFEVLQLHVQMLVYIKMPFFQLVFLHLIQIFAEFVILAGCKRMMISVNILLVSNFNLQSL